MCEDKIFEDAKFLAELLASRKENCVNAHGPRNDIRVDLDDQYNHLHYYERCGGWLVKDKEI